MTPTPTLKFPAPFASFCLCLLCGLPGFLPAQSTPGVSATPGLHRVADTAFFTRRLNDEIGAMKHFAALLKDSASRPLVDSAIRHSDVAMDLADSLSDRKTLGELYLARSGFEYQHRDYEQAINFYTAGWNITDSLSSQQKRNELSELQGKQDLETREKEIALRKLEASVQQRTLLALLSALVLLCLIGGLLLRQNHLRRRTNSTLLVLNDKLEEANKIKARFFGILSHDLRSPVANLLSFLQLMKEDPDSLSPEQKAGQQEEINRSAEGLLETMEAMLLWSKEQMNSFKPELRQIRVGNLFQYLEKFFVARGQAELVFSGPGDLFLAGDENYLRVIMQNLTSNALKALKDKPDGRVEWHVDETDGEVRLSVTDNGPGLSKEKAAALYAETGAVNARSGFGFHLIRDLAAAIGYRIAVDSTAGKGTRFILQTVNPQNSIVVPA